MAYDHFASLPPSQQKTVMISGGGVFSLMVLGFLLSCVFNLLSYNHQSKMADEMVTMLQDYQRARQSRASDVAFLERNRRIAAPGALKQHLLRQGNSAKISPRLMEIKEIESQAPVGEEGVGDIQLRQASVRLQRVNLSQLQGFLQKIEFGAYNLSINSLRIQNDDKLRGYMNVDIAIIAYLFTGNIES